MLRYIVYGLIVYFTSLSAAYACSCVCNYEQKISDYMNTAKIFWATPIESKLQHEISSSNIYRHKQVVTKVVVIEGYGRIGNSSELIVRSAPDDGGSCGVQLNLGTPEFISTSGEDNTLSTCNCEPPLTAILDYLNNGQDAYIPSLDECMLPNGEFNSSDRCLVWVKSKEEAKVLHKERMRIYGILQSRRSK